MNINELGEDLEQQFGKPRNITEENVRFMLSLIKEEFDGTKVNENIEKPSLEAFGMTILAVMSYQTTPWEELAKKPSIRKTLKYIAIRGNDHYDEMEALTKELIRKHFDDTNKDTKDTPHWYALRTTYGREKNAYNYLLSKNVVAFYPTLKSVKLVDSKRITIEESRIPNIFFAYGTEDELKYFVYDNVNLPYLRFYYRHTHVGNKIVKAPLVVPDNQMNSLKIICAADSDDIIASTEEVEKFKTGQKVWITEGKFAGVTGIVARYQSQQRVGIVIDGLLTVCTAYVPSAFLEIEDK